jgi:two-component system OmpR family response regulator
MATVLIVDDEPDICELIARYLEGGGHHPICAANGWEALLALDAHAIDLILLDVTMPGMDGVTFLKILRNAQKKMKTPVIVVTALSEQDASKRLRDLEVDAILTKNQSLYGELVHRDNQALAASTSQGASAGLTFHQN